MRILENPKTELYLDLKKNVLSQNFQWYWNEYSTIGLFQNNYANVPFYSHIFLKRPEQTKTKVPTAHSSFAENACSVFLEIMQHNKIKINHFLRINANCVHPQESILNTVPHTDHPFSHKNMILYLTDAGGNTMILDEDQYKPFEPKEDDVIVFDGVSHYVTTPKEKRRVILVATFV